MKKLLLILLLGACAAQQKQESIAVQNYRAQIQQCDDELSMSNSSDNLESWQIRDNLSGQNACYNKIAKQIISKYYQVPETMELHDSYIKSMVGATNYLYSNKAECYPACGTIGTEIGINETHEFLKFYLERMLVWVDWFELGK